MEVTMLSSSLADSRKDSEFELQNHLNDFYPNLLQLLLLLLTFTYGLYSLIHRRFSSRKGRGTYESWRIKSRRFFARRVVVWSWDLRGNRGMFMLWVLWVELNGWWSFTYTNPKKLAGIDHMTYPFLRYFANRTGNLCYANLPILFLLVSRGNLISRISGIGLQDLNWFHRWVGWLTFVLGMLHVVFYTVWLFLLTSPSRLYGFFFHLRFMQAGLVATGAFVLLVLLSVRWVRTHYHEVFITSHVSLSFVFLIGCYYHWKPRGTLPLVALFILTSSHAHRVYTVVFNSAVRPLLAGRRNGSRARWATLRRGFLDATVEIVDEKCLRMRVSVPDGMEWKIGDWVKIMVGNGFGWGQWHPFSITNLPNSIASASSCLSSSDPKHTPPSEMQPLLPHPPTSPSPQPRNEMVFLIAAYSSFTAKLYQAALASETPLHVPILIEGPYGQSPHLKGVDTLVLVGGGTGAALVQNVWEGALREVEKRKREEGSEEVGIRRLVVYWIVKERHHFRWIPLPTLLSHTSPFLLDVETDLHLHCTSSALPSDVGVAGDVGSATIEGGRPKWGEAIDRLAREAEGRVQVVVCGPSSLANEVVDASLDACTPSDRSLRDVRVEVELFD